MHSNRQQAINTDHAEMEFYNELAALWWDATGPMWPLHKLNQLRSVYIVEEVCRHLRLTWDAAGDFSAKRSRRWVPE